MLTAGSASPSANQAHKRPTLRSRVVCSLTHVPQKWDGTSAMRYLNCGFNAPASEFGITEFTELNHDISTLGLQHS